MLAVAASGSRFRRQPCRRRLRQHAAVGRGAGDRCFRPGGGGRRPRRFRRPRYSGTRWQRRRRRRGGGVGAGGGRSGGGEPRRRRRLPGPRHLRRQDPGARFPSRHADGGDDGLAGGGSGLGTRTGGVGAPARPPGLVAADRAGRTAGALRHLGRRRPCGRSGHCGAPARRPLGAPDFLRRRRAAGDRRRAYPAGACGNPGAPGAQRRRRLLHRRRRPGDLARRRGRRHGPGAQRSRRLSRQMAGAEAGELR